MLQIVLESALEITVLLKKFTYLGPYYIQNIYILSDLGCSLRRHFCSLTV